MGERARLCAQGVREFACQTKCHRLLAICALCGFLFSLNANAVLAPWTWGHMILGITPPNASSDAACARHYDRHPTHSFAGSFDEALINYSSHMAGFYWGPGSIKARCFS